MNENEKIIQFPGTKRIRFDLFIVHPTLSADAISADLGLEAHFSHSAHEPRLTPTGEQLSGRHAETRWRHCRSQLLPDQHFASYLLQFLDSLDPRASYFADVVAAGGQASIIISFLGDGHYGDCLERPVLAKLIALNLDLEIESYSTKQQ